MGHFDGPGTTAIGSSSASEFGCQQPAVRSGNAEVPACTAAVMRNSGEPNSTSRVPRRGACEVPHNLILPSHGRVEEHGRQRGVAPLRAALAGRIRVCRVRSTLLGQREARVSDVRHLPIYEEVAAAPS